MPSVMPWYCSAPSFITDSWFPSCVPSADQQVAMMRGNFGPSADPRLVDMATRDFAGYLANSNYNTTIQSLEQSGNPFSLPKLDFDFNSLVIPIMIGVGTVIAIKLVKGR